MHGETDLLHRGRKGCECPARYDGTPLAGVENSGSIKAEGGVVVLTAAQLDGIVGSVVNSGEVSAASAELKGGKITFRGEGSQVDVRNTGTLMPRR